MRFAPQWNHAYLVPGYIDGSQIVFFFRSTGNLKMVSVDLYRTGTDFRPYQLYPLIREGRESLPNVRLPVGDWTLDIDAVGRYGKMLERIIIETDSVGKPVVTFMRVTRNRDGVLMCQTPKQRPPLCYDTTD